MVEIASAVEVGICVNASVETFAVEEKGKKFDEKNTLVKGSFYFDEIGFSIPPLGCELNATNQFLLRRAWLHLRQYHGLLSEYRCIEWSASEWCLDKTAVGARAQQLLITSHVSQAKITKGVLSEGGDCVGSSSSGDGSSGGSSNNSSSSSSTPNNTATATATATAAATAAITLTHRKHHVPSHKSFNRSETSNSTLQTRELEPFQVPIIMQRNEEREEERDDREEEREEERKERKEEDYQRKSSGTFDDGATTTPQLKTKSNPTTTITSPSSVPRCPSSVPRWNQSNTLRPLTGPNRAHTPSDVGRTYEELVLEMEHQRKKSTSHKRRKSRRSMTDSTDSNNR